MKKLLALAIICAMMFALAIPAAAAPGNENFGNVKKISDSDINMGNGERDAAWDFALAIPVMTPAAEGSGDESANGTTWMLWSDTAFYFYTEVNDSTPVSRDMAGWADGEFFEAWVSDSVEVFIAVEGDQGNLDVTATGNFDEHCWQFRVDRDNIPSTYQRGGAWTDDFMCGASVNGDRMQWAVKTDGNKYYVKMKITHLGAPKPGELGLQIQINDLQEEYGGAPQTRANDAMGSWNVDEFGYVVLVDEAAIPPAAEVPEEPAADDGKEEDAPAITNTPAPTTSPRTNDAGIIALIALMAIAAAGIVVLRRKSVR